MNAFQNILEAIGNTPLITLEKISSGVSSTTKYSLSGRRGNPLPPGWQRDWELGPAHQVLVHTPSRIPALSYGPHH